LNYRPKILYALLSKAHANRAAWPLAADPVRAPSG